MKRGRFDTKDDWIRYLKSLYLQARDLKRYCLEMLKEAGIDQVEEVKS